MYAATQHWLRCTCSKGTILLRYIASHCACHKHNKAAHATDIDDGEPRKDHRSVIQTRRAQGSVCAEGPIYAKKLQTIANLASHHLLFPWRIAGLLLIGSVGHQTQFGVYPWRSSTTKGAASRHRLFPTRQWSKEWRRSKAYTHHRPGGRFLATQRYVLFHATWCQFTLRNLVLEWSVPSSSRIWANVDV